MALKPISTEHGAREILKRLVEAGRCTIEDLDKPPASHLRPDSYRNLLRDIPPEPKVSVSESRDFSPTQSDLKKDDSEEALPF